MQAQKSLQADIHFGRTKNQIYNSAKCAGRTCNRRNFGRKIRACFFANENGIPVAAIASPITSIPVIASISAESAVTGQTIIIRGINFGSSKGKSKVYFTANRDETSSLHSSEQNENQDKNNIFIPATETDFDYIAWTDSEISVKIPDGASSGSVFIETPHGTSAAKK